MIKQPINLLSTPLKIATSLHSEWCLGKLCFKSATMKWRNAPPHSIIHPRKMRLNALATSLKSHLTFLPHSPHLLDMIWMRWAPIWLSPTSSHSYVVLHSMVTLQYLIVNNNNLHSSLIFRILLKIIPVR